MLPLDDAPSLLAAPSVVQADWDLNAKIGLNVPGAFVFRMRSASGERLGIMPGDYVVMRRDMLPTIGCLLIVYLRGRFRLMEFTENKCSELDHAQIVGVVCAVFRKTAHKEMPKEHARTPDKVYNQ